MASSAAKRPWLAAVLTILVTGLGHVYLRRWIRAIAWIVLAILSVWIFVPEGAVMEATFTDIAPMAVVIVMSVLDAYMVAKDHNRQLEAANRERCPSCNRGIDEGLDFCWNCATELESDAEA